jgi:hypothetical protein
MLAPAISVIPVPLEPEILDFRSDSRGQRSRVEQRDLTDPSFAFEQCRPGRFQVVSDRSDHAHSCDNDTTHEWNSL